VPEPVVAGGHDRPQQQPREDGRLRNEVRAQADTQMTSVENTQNEVKGSRIDDGSKGYYLPTSKVNHELNVYDQEDYTLQRQIELKQTYLSHVYSLQKSLIEMQERWKHEENKPVQTNDRWGLRSRACIYSAQPGTMITPVKSASVRSEPKQDETK